MTGNLTCAFFFSENANRIILLFLSRQVLQTKRDNVTKESNEFKGEYGRYMATMSKKVTEGKAEHSRLTERVSVKSLTAFTGHSFWMWNS